MEIGTSICIYRISDGRTHTCTVVNFGFLRTRMTKHLCFFFSLVCYSFLSGRNGVAADSTTVTCRTGWTEDSTTSSIPKEWINDGYCDCPFDGKDEPDTNACSGSLSWPGVASSPTSRYGVYSRLNTHVTRHFFLFLLSSNARLRK